MGLAGVEVWGWDQLGVVAVSTVAWIPGQCQWPGWTGDPTVCRSCHRMLSGPWSHPDEEDRQRHRDRNTGNAGGTQPPLTACQQQSKTGPA